MILVGIPSLSICHTAIHLRMKQAEDGLNEHIRGQSMVASVHGKGSQRNSREYTPNPDSDVCRPLLVSDSESGETADGNTDTASNTQVNASSAAATAKPKSFLSMLTLHNFNILVIRCLAMSNLVTLSHVDTTLLYHKQQLLLSQQLHSQPSALEETMAPSSSSLPENNVHVSTDVY